jgi:ribosomal protein S18 acetylase RimI-like enzyme
MSNIAIDKLSARGLVDELDGLTGVLHACVAAGASVNFVLPFSRNEAAAFWLQKVHPALKSGVRLLLVARMGEDLAGTVQLDLDTPPNQAHRAEVSKLLVHPDFRRRGIARRLMQAVEAEALVAGRTLLTLDTRTGDSAEPLYRSLGFVAAGTIPGFCRATDADRLDSTTYMYKALGGIDRAGPVAAKLNFSVNNDVEIA